MIAAAERQSLPFLAVRPRTVTSAGSAAGANTAQTASSPAIGPATGTPRAPRKPGHRSAASEVSPAAATIAAGGSTISRYRGTQNDGPRADTTSTVTSGTAAAASVCTRRRTGRQAAMVTSPSRSQAAGAEPTTPAGKP